MSFTDRTTSIFKIIKTTYNVETLRMARRLERTLVSQVRYKQHIHYLHRCKENGFLPRFLQSRPPIDHPVAWEIATKTGWAYLRVFIGDCHRKINQLDEVVRNVNSQAEQSLAAEHYNILHSRVKERCRYEKETTKERHRRKFQSCSGTSQHESVKKKWVINASTRNLSRNEIDLLQKGLNFAITPRAVPTKEILAAVVNKGYATLLRKSERSETESNQHVETS